MKTSGLPRRVKDSEGQPLLFMDVSNRSFNELQVYWKEEGRMACRVHDELYGFVVRGT